MVLAGMEGFFFCKKQLRVIKITPSSMASDSGKHEEETYLMLKISRQYLLHFTGVFELFFCIFHLLQMCVHLI